MAYTRPLTPEEMQHSADGRGSHLATTYLSQAGYGYGPGPGWEVQADCNYGVQDEGRSTMSKEPRYDLAYHHLAAGLQSLMLWMRNPEAPRVDFTIEIEHAVERAEQFAREQSK